MNRLNYHKYTENDTKTTPTRHNSAVDFRPARGPIMHSTQGRVEYFFTLESGTADNVINQYVWMFTHFLHVSTQMRLY